MIQLNDQRYWLYVAIDPDTNELLHTRLEPTRTGVIAHAFFIELHEKHDISDAVFLIDGATPLNAVRSRHGLDFRYERHGNRNSAESVLKEIKSQSFLFSNIFSNVEPPTQNRDSKPSASGRIVLNLIRGRYDRDFLAGATLAVCRQPRVRPFGRSQY